MNVKGVVGTEPSTMACNLTSDERLTKSGRVYYLRLFDRRVECASAPKSVRSNYDPDCVYHTHPWPWLNNPVEPDHLTSNLHSKGSQV